MQKCGLCTFGFCWFSFALEEHRELLPLSIKAIKGNKLVYLLLGPRYILINIVYLY